MATTGIILGFVDATVAAFEQALFKICALEICFQASFLSEVETKMPAKRENGGFSICPSLYFESVTSCPPLGDVAGICMYRCTT